MPVLAIIGALAAAVLGAAIWAAISAMTGYEVGYVAWGIGALVGGGSAVLGGRGAPSGVLCAMLALLSIFAGKVAAVHYVFQSELRKELDKVLTRDSHAEMVADAEAFAGVKSDEGYPAFMVAHHYIEAAKPEDVAPKDVALFKQENVPHLLWLNQDKPAYEAWRARREKVVMDVALTKFSRVDAAVKGMNGFDLIFGLLGLATAFRIGRGKADETAPGSDASPPGRPA